jgi:hypothetical protein
VRRKVYESWYPTKPPPPPDINKKATRRPRVAQPFICLEFQLCSQPTSCRCPSFVSFEASSLLEDVSVAMAKAPNGVFSCLYICARGTKLALFSKALEPHSLEVFQRWRAHHGHGHRSSRQVPVWSGACRCDRTRCCYRFQYYRPQLFPPPRALHAADGTTPQKTAVYPRIIPRTGQFGTVSELKPSHTLHASRLKPMANMPHYFKATPLGCRCMAANASDDLVSGSYRRICMLRISACCLTSRPAGMRVDSQSTRSSG